MRKKWRKALYKTIGASGGLGLLALVTGLAYCVNVSPGVPVPISPAEINTGNQSSVIFMWRWAQNATEYGLEISTDEDFSSVVYSNLAVEDTFLGVDSDNLDADEIYFWRVNAANRNTCSDYSEPLRFIHSDAAWPPGLISPSDGEELDTEHPSFTWHSHPSATGYLFRLYRDSFPAGEVITETTLIDTSYRLATELLDQLPGWTCLWSIAPLPFYKSYTWCPYFTFTCPETDYPGKVELIYPEDGAYFENTAPYFRWHSDTLAGSYIIHISGTSDVLVTDTLVDDTTYFMPQGVYDEAENGDYFWKVAPLPARNEPLWSDTRGFTLAKITPPDILLDTTYFPFSLGFQWIYSVHTHGYERWPAGGIDTTWEMYTTASVAVTDSILTPSGWTFKITGGLYDIGYDSVEISDAKLWVFIDVSGDSAQVSLIPDTGEGSQNVAVNYSGDTVVMTDSVHISLSASPDTLEYERWTTKRLTHIGLVQQSYRYYESRDDGHELERNTEFLLTDF